jgi:hypothetical protein
MVIFKVTHRDTDKVYIGYSVNDSPSYLGSGRYITHALRQFGRDAFQKNEVELEDDEVLPETLAFSALVIKLVEMGKLSPEDAEDFLEDYFG